jgi:diketogulonate reductase-like aldo/keto reductase
MNRTLDVHGVPVPRFLYGTAWKEEDTERQVRQALEAGFTGVDTANQRKHYHEAGVGSAVRAALASGRLSREQLFLQTKFTHRGGQDHRLPYDESAPVAEQVRQSFASSLEHLGVERLDAYVLHGPSTRPGLAPVDWEAWSAMEAAHAEGKTRLLGISNVTVEQLEQLCSRAKTPPALVQNRCYARLGWDREVRHFCRANGLAFEGFSLLTANERELRAAAITAPARRLGVTPAQVAFRFALEVEMICLTGSSDPAHLAEDLACFDFELTQAEREAIERISG